MLLAEHSSYGYGFGYGFGAARTLVQGTDFNCNSSICYGIGSANHALFQQLQTTLNTYAKLGISAYRSQLTVDGFLGDQSLSAARAACAAALVSAPSTKPQLAANAAIINDQLQAFINGSQPQQSQSPSVMTPSQQAVSTSSVPTSPSTSAAVPLPSAVKTPSAIRIPGVTPTPMPASAMPSAALTPVASSSSKMPLWVWITAGVVGVIVVGTVGYVVLREPEAKPALARRRRRRK